MKNIMKKNRKKLNIHQDIVAELLENITHLWKQPLSIITINSSNLQLEKEFNLLSEEKLKKFTKEIEKEVKYLSQTVDIFRAFIKKDNFIKRVNLVEVIESVVDIFSFSYREKNIIVEFNSNSNKIISYMWVSELIKIVINILYSLKEALLKKEIKKPKIKINLISQKNKIIIEIVANLSIKKGLIEKKEIKNLIKKSLKGDFKVDKHGFTILLFNDYI